jgi:hypothetical protein
MAHRVMFTRAYLAAKVEYKFSKKAAMDAAKLRKQAVGPSS